LPSPGTTVGTAVGTAVGTCVGTAVGTDVGTAVGTGVGTTVGTDVGTCVGTGVAVGAVVGAVVGTTVGTDVGTTVGTDVGTAVGITVGTAVGFGDGAPSTVIVPPVAVGVPITTPAASFKFLTESPILAIASSVVAGVRVILIRARSALPAMPFALKPAVTIWPATVVLFVKLRPAVISVMVPKVNTLVGYVTVNPNAPSRALPVFA